MLARPEVHSWHQYNFAGSITMVFASGIGLRLDSLNCAVEQLDDFAGWVKAKRVELAPPCKLSSLAES
jgi:hypothetical protein